MLVVSLMRLKEEEDKLCEQFPNVDFKFYKHPAELPKEIQRKMDVLISYHQVVDEQFIDDAVNLKWIAWYATGVNSLPLKKLRERGIRLTNAKGVHAQQLSEWIFAYILDDYKAMKEVYKEQQERQYNSKRLTQSLNDATILFLGTGVIPQRAAQIAKVFGMKTIGLNTSGHSVEHFDKTYPLSERKHLYKEADIIVNVLPETSETYHLLTAYDFKAMNEHSLFINIGRGTITETNILVKAMKEKWIRAAYLDVFEEEPLTPDSPLYKIENVFLTSHITGNGSQNKMKATKILIKNLNSFLNCDALIENEVDLTKGY
ncbi:phosphoglycerate dehydrogenase [Staphylococcus sp. 17KM0847]|uniref:phosphoglycerate dehydrogenase n=1 Tax=Staphylococcus sp. 17KM0847 TaxID=2583989 RepID=UPI0015DC031E|nr:phosphoglycerate dehydrogenase [Staphylococcus sp. 17KM0847]QLK86362.1 hydroxyacid dehydrogenase [Staphylococcus sp. 17KM0847]